MIYLDSVHSTNDYALDLLSKNNPIHGTVVITDNQTQGKGQHGSKWVSNSYQNLTLSVILRPEQMRASNQFWMNKSIAVGIRNTVHHFTKKPVFIKWSNDIYVDDKKISGTLIQNQITGGGLLSNAVVGIGINVNQHSFDIDKKATSLSNEIERNISVQEVLNVLLRELKHSWSILHSGDFEMIQGEYMSHLWRHQEASWFMDNKNNSKFEGMITNVTDEGLLEVYIPKVGQKLFGIKEISFL